MPEGRTVALLALTVALALPPTGVLVVGSSLGGVELGMTPAQVQHVWGTRYGRCRGCADETWYYTNRKYRPDGAAVRFRRGRVSAVWTLWSPLGWRTRDAKLAIGMNALAVNGRYGALVSIPCGTYHALILTRGNVTTSFYVYGQKLWGFGLAPPGTSPCR
jgi:hypothetical protein